MGNVFSIPCIFHQMAWNEEQNSKRTNISHDSWQSRRRHKSIIQLLVDVNGEADEKKIKHIVNLSIGALFLLSLFFTLLLFTLALKAAYIFCSQWITSVDITQTAQPVAIECDLIQSEEMRFVVQWSIDWRMSVDLRVYVRQYNWFKPTREKNITG